MAVLDAISSQEWQDRYYSYNKDWAPDEEALTMRNGSGDDMQILFRAEGCVINGLMHEYSQPNKAQATYGLPNCFADFMFGEPVQSIGTTFCLWYTAAHGWQTGVIENEDDGSEELLSIFDGNPETYADWANEYFLEDTGRSPIEPDDVAKIYRGETLTKAMVLAIANDLEDWSQLEEDLQTIGYPYDFS